MKVLFTQLRRPLYLFTFTEDTTYQWGSPRDLIGARILEYLYL